MSTLSDGSKAQLLALSRGALIDAANLRPLNPLQVDQYFDELRAIRTSFVTLREQEQLRGCIGGLEAKIPLAEDVRQHAYAAARYDYRFPPVQAGEVGRITIEVSVLSQPKTLEYSSPNELADWLQAHHDGVIIEYMNRRATFLPQVWKRIPLVDQFLTLLCEKAGLPADAWKTKNLNVYVYQVEEFEENEAEP